MNKGSLIDTIFANAKASSIQISKNDLSKITDMFFDAIVDGVRKDKIVRIVGFGTWMCVERKARKGRNPSTGKEILIPARKDMKFSVGKKTKAIINNY